MKPRLPRRVRPAGPVDLGAALGALDQVVDAAATLGLDPEPARHAAQEARTRLAFPGSTFVLALAGGTGSGKSSLLNALAGTEVSRAGATRPVTAEPVAWVPAARAAELAPLLDWVGAGRVVTHDNPRFAGVCLLDLPDADSVERANRARVDLVLPRVDAVCWVLDPEKYNDRVLHEEYLRPLARHARRMVFVLNRIDRLGADTGAVVADVRRVLEADGIEGRPVFAVAAAPGGANPSSPGVDRHGELDGLRDWLAERADAKAVVTGRLAADCQAAGEALGRAAGVTGTGSAPAVLVDETTRAAARERATVAARAAVDVAGVRQACVRRAQAEARAAGAGPVGRLVGVFARRRGRGSDAGRTVDPVGYARAWRQRATLARASEPVRDLLVRGAAQVPPELRPAVAGTRDGGNLEERLAAAVDDAVAQAAADGGDRVPRSWVWPLVGVAQALTLGAVLLGVLWLVAIAVAGYARIALLALPALTWPPFLEGLPVPVALVGGGVLAGLVLSRVLEASAVHTGRRWADRLARALDRRVAAEVDQAVGDPLAAVEDGRGRLHAALVDLRRTTGGG